MADNIQEVGARRRLEKLTRMILLAACVAAGFAFPTLIALATYTLGRMVRV